MEVPKVCLGEQATYPLKTKRLPVRVGDKESSRTVETKFLVVDITRAYNVILEHPPLMSSEP